MIADALRCKLASDDGLGRLAAAGAPGAADAVCERFREPLARYCRALVRDPDDAQEATQVALERAVRSLGGGDAPRALRPWLYRIAHNAAMDVVRARRPHAALDDVADDLLGDAGPSAGAREQLAEVLADLRALPERQRGALLLRELAGLSYGELATALDTTVQAARQSVFEARAGIATVQAGRAASCEAVRHTLSDGDRRRVRSRSVRAHLDDCGGCREFARSIRSRRRVLGLLPVPWAATLAAGAAGVGTSATGVVVGGWTAGKAVAALAAAATATAGSVATVERLAEAPRRERATQQRAQDGERRTPSVRASAVAATPPVTAAATSAAMPVRAAGTSSRRDARRTRPAEPRTQRRPRRSPEAVTAPARAVEAPPAPAPASTPTAGTPADARRQAWEDARRRTEQALAETQARTRETVERIQTATRQAVADTQARTQETLQAVRESTHQATLQTQRTIEAVTQATRQQLESTRAALQQALGTVRDADAGR